MKKTFAFIFLTGFLHADTLQDATLAWQNRDKPGQTEHAIELWQKSLAENPNQPSLYTSVTHACGRAYRNETNKSLKKKWAKCGKEFAMVAMAKNPNSPEAYAQAAVAFGQWAQASKSISSLSYVKKAITTLKRAIALNPDYDFAHMLLAQYYLKSPRLLSVGDPKKAFTHAKMAVRLAPQYAINHLTLAEVYLDQGKQSEAGFHLKQALALTPPPDMIPETKADQETARKLLENMQTNRNTK